MVTLSISTSAEVGLMLLRGSSFLAYLLIMVNAILFKIPIPQPIVTGTAHSKNKNEISRFIY